MLPVKEQVTMYGPLCFSSPDSCLLTCIYLHLPGHRQQNVCCLSAVSRTLFTSSHCQWLLLLCRWLPHVHS